MEKEYFLGFDIGVGSVGYAVTDTQYRLQKVNRKYAWGSVLFETSDGAESRRINRSNRRRWKREKMRLELLRELFEEEVAKVDLGFFLRLQESRYVPEDKLDANGACPELPYSLFVDEGYTDVEYHKEFPTVYHLRKALIEGEREYDVRLVYLAIAHILKNRGHFFSNVKSDGASDNMQEVLERLFDSWRRLVLDQEESFCSAGQLEGIMEVLKNVQMPKSVKKQEIMRIIDAKDKRNKELAALISGGTTKFEKLFGVEEFAELEENSICFDKDGYEEKEAVYAETLGEYFEVIEHAKAVYDQMLLSHILREGSRGYLSFAKVQEYEQHQHDLRTLKKLILEHGTGSVEDRKKLYDRTFRAPQMAGKKQECNYSAYVGSASVNGEKIFIDKTATRDEFYDFLRKQIFKEIEECDQKDEILQQIQLEEFMPKLRVRDNSVIPHQLHERELKAILHNAEKYLPFLKNVDETGKSVSEKIQMLLTFRIPYYVGPLNENSSKSWVVRRQTGRVTPWNFEQMVDVEESAKGFIENLTSKCTYLKKENVLPKSSLMYEKFMVLNEINHLKIKSEPISVELKKEIYQNLFEKKLKVTVKKLLDYLKREKGLVLAKEDITGIDGEFKTALKSYHAFKETFTGAELGEQDKEKIICELTLFGAEPAMLKKRLHAQYPGYEKQLNALMRTLKCTDWGRLSEKLLNGIAIEVPGLGRIGTVLYEMWETNAGLMELLTASNSPFAELIQQENGQEQAEKLDYSLVDSLYVSPSVKRSLWKTVQVLDEIVRVMKCPPKRVFVEMTREHQDSGRSVSRKDRLMNLYKNIKDEQELYDSLASTDNDRLRSDKLYLYFTQLGRCAYTGNVINLDEFDKYDIDHIYPQSKTADDSLDNRVLVYRPVNGEKSDVYPIAPEIQQKMSDSWRIWKDKGLISAEKYYRLTRKTELTNDELTGFINRHLVETSQSVRAFTELLKQLLPQETEIVYSKARNVSRFRQKFELLKVRELNDLHHAKDAYLNIVVGNVYHIRFTKDIRKYFMEKGTYRTYNLEHLFENNVKLGNEIAWKTGEEQSIVTVKKVLSNNKVQVTRQLLEKKGQLFDVNPVKKGKGQVLLKERAGYERLQDIDKYGGYNSASIAYFMIVEGEDKKGRPMKRFIPVPIYQKKKYEQDAEFFEKEMKEKYKLEHVQVIKDKILINTLFVTSGFQMRLTGKSGEQLIFNNANQLLLDEGYHKTLKEVVKYAMDVKVKKDAKINPKSGLTGENMFCLYQQFQDKIRKSIYSQKSTFNIVLGVMEKGEEKFRNLPCEEQAFVLFQILKLFQCTPEMPDLSKIGGSKTMARINIVMNITKMDNLAIIHQSVTGLYERIERII